MRKIRNIAAVILAVLCCFAAVSCASSEPETVPEYEISELANDLDGFEMIYSCSNNNTYYENILGYIPNTALADLAAKRLSDVQKQYNCVITVDSTDHGTSYDRMYASVLSGIRYCDAIQNESYKMISAVRAGYLEGLSEYLDLSDTAKWGTPGMLQSMCWKNDAYAVLPAAWPDLLYQSIGYPICVNENLVASFGVADPRDYVENNTWTWDQFETFLHEMTRTEGDRTTYGIQVHPAYFIQMFARSNGDSLVENMGGEVVCGLFTSSAAAAFERAQKIYYETCKECFYPGTGTDVDAFLSENAALAMTGTSGIFGSETAILYRMENIGIIPCPLGPNAKPGEYKSTYESMLYSISMPVTCADFSATAVILDAIYEPFEGYETDDDIIDYMMHSVFFDERDVSIILSMLRNSEYAFFLEKARSLPETIISSSGSVTETIESYRDVYDGIVDEFMAHHYHGQQAVWGENFQ